MPTPTPAHHTTSPDKQLLEAEDLVIGTLGRVSRFWGFTHSLGRVFGLLYLSPAPLDRQQIQARLAISSGNASMALKELSRWGVVHKTGVRGNRRIHYRAETDFWRIVSSVLNERERRVVQTAESDAARAIKLVQGLRRRERGAARQPLDFALERMQRLHGLYVLAQRLLDLLLATRRVDIAPHHSRLGSPAPR